MMMFCFPLSHCSYQGNTKALKKILTVVKQVKPAKADKEAQKFIADHSD
jgi:hypothetical protein